MKLIVLALVLFFLNLSVVITDELGIFSYNIATQSGWRDDIEAIKGQKFDPDISADVSTSFGFGDFVSGFKNFVDALWRITLVGEQLKMFGLQNSPTCLDCDRISNLFSIAGMMIYLLGIAQFISNRGTKGMQ